MSGTTRTRFVDLKLITSANHTLNQDRIDRTDYTIATSFRRHIEVDMPAEATVFFRTS